MTEREQLIQEIRARLSEIPKGSPRIDALAFATTIGQGYSLPEDEIVEITIKEATDLGLDYHANTKPEPRGKTTTRPTK